MLTRVIGWKNRERQVSVMEDATFRMFLVIAAFGLLGAALGLMFLSMIAMHLKNKQQKHDALIKAIRHD